MNIHNKLRFAVYFIAVATLTFIACKKNTTTTTTTPALTNADDNGGYASDQAILESHTNSAMTMADAAASGNGSSLRVTSSCATVSFDTIAHIMTIDFGPTDCTCADGKIRRGKIIVSNSGHYKDSGSSHTITSSNYYVDDYKVVLNKTVQNMGRNSAAQYWYNVTVNDSVYLTSDSVISWTGNRTRTWINGYGSATILDDEYQIGGTTTVTRANGHAFTFTIEPAFPLIVRVDCRWIEAGKVDISGTYVAGGPYIINYGDTPSCDWNATITIGAHVYPIILRH